MGLGTYSSYKSPNFLDSFKFLFSWFPDFNLHVVTRLHASIYLEYELKSDTFDKILSIIFLPLLSRRKKLKKDYNIVLLLH